MKPPKKGPFLDGNRPQAADWLNAIVGESADWLNAIVGVFADWLNAIVSESADWLNAILSREFRLAQCYSFALKAARFSSKKRQYGADFCSKSVKMCAKRSVHGFRGNDHRARDLKSDWLNAIVGKSADWLNAILLSPRAWIGLGIGQDQVPVKHSAALEGNRLACIEETKWRAVERNRAAQQHCREARHIGEISTEESTASGGAGEKGEPDSN